MTGRIIQGIGGFYTVLSDSDLYVLRPRGRLRREKVTPMVGDNVAFTPGEGEQHGFLDEVLPRRNLLTRPPVSNIDLIVITISPQSPPPDLLLVDRMLLTANEAGISAMLLINKRELDEQGCEALASQYANAGLKDILRVSAANGDGLSNLRSRLQGSAHAFAGQSGVGKSSLINALYGRDLVVGDVSHRLSRGKHTTRRVELIPLGAGTMVLDTPGFSLLEMALTDPVLLPGRMPEFGPYNGKCYFTPCAHVTEPGCAVREAVEAGAISRERWERYREIHEDMRLRWRERYGK